MIAKYLWSSSNPWTSHARCSKELCSEDLCSEKRGPLLCSLLLAKCPLLCTSIRRLSLVWAAAGLAATIKGQACLG